MAKQSSEQKEIVERVMHEFAHGELETGTGAKVKSRRQAVAIALSEAGESNQQTPAENRANLKKTRARQREGGERTKAELYAQAQKQDVPGRSKMSKAELERAVSRR